MCRTRFFLCVLREKKIVHDEKKIECLDTGEDERPTNLGGRQQRALGHWAVVQDARAQGRKLNDKKAENQDQEEKITDCVGRCDDPQPPRLVAKNLVRHNKLVSNVASVDRKTQDQPRKFSWQFPKLQKSSRALSACPWVMFALLGKRHQKEPSHVVDFRKRL